MATGRAENRERTDIGKLTRRVAEFERGTHSTTEAVNPVQLRAFTDLLTVKYRKERPDDGRRPQVRVACRRRLRSSWT
jgi:hypothetical protein